MIQQKKLKGGFWGQQYGRQRMNERRETGEAENCKQRPQS